MVKGLYTAWTGMVNEQNRMDVLTNNLANVNTTGYKKEGATSQAFSDVLGLKIKDLSEAPNTARRLGTMNMGVKIGEGYTDYTDGPMKSTGNTYDLALQGKGFFAIDYTNKAANVERTDANQQTTMYTRDGNFTLDTNGNLVTDDGDFVLDTDGNHIKLNPNLSSQINTKGQIIQDGNVVATIQVADFADYNYLEHYGENYFQPVDGATKTDATATVNSGFLEQSNVSAVDEMVSIIAVQRNYEANQKMIQTEDTTLNTATTELGRL
ncbi:MAG: flagellar hook-basal body protein [Butyrivibrio sp.]|jgi:flagellar basal-body rod protein FlgG|nr:flagellar hook-basal body protein [Butyrivibrio sp.]